MTADDGLDLGGRRVLAPGRWLWLRALAWGAALFFLVLAAAGGFGIAASWLVAAVSGGGASLGLANRAGFAAMAVGSLAAYVGLVRLAEDRRPSELALRPAPRELASGLLLGGLMMAATILLLHLAGAIVLVSRPIGYVGDAVALAFQSGVVEEILLRLVVLRLLWRAFGPWAALAFSAALFGALHLANPHSSLFAALAIAVEAGMMLGAFYILTGRLWMSIGVHAGWNFTQGWLFGAAVSGTDDFAGGPLDLAPSPGVPEWVSGGGFGPEASLAGLLVGTAVGLVTLRLAWRRGRFGTGSAAPRLDD